MQGDEGDADAIPAVSSKASSPTWAVEEALPNGRVQLPVVITSNNEPRRWGRNSSRTSLYKVPLIVVASIILAIGIVVGIV